MIDLEISKKNQGKDERKSKMKSCYFYNNTQLKTIRSGVAVWLINVLCMWK